MKDIDSQIKKDLSADLPLPESFTNMVRNTIKSQKSKKQKKKVIMLKTMAAACACILVTTSLVFAKDITKFINTFWKENKGIDTAIENGYIHQPNREYTESKGTKIRVNEFLMDENNLCLTFSLKPKEGINLNKIQKIDFSDMIITDENKRILYCEDKNTFEEYSKKNELDNVWKEESETNINSGSNWFIQSKSETEIQLVYNLYASQFPQSKKINIHMTQIILFLQEDKSEENITLTGDWELTIDVPKEFYQSEKIVYQVKECNDPNIKSSKITVSETNTKFEMEIEEKAELPYEMTDDEETKERKINEYIEKQNQESFEDYQNRKKFKNEYIENEKGEKFYSTSSSMENSGYSNNNKGIKYWQTFTLTKFQATDELILHITYQGDEIIIKAVKE